MLVFFEIIRKYRGDKVVTTQHHQQEGVPKGLQRTPSEVELEKKYWISAVWSIDDDTIKKKRGQDVLLYLTYMKYCSILFAIISLSSCLILLPFYLYYKDNKYRDSLIQRLTLLPYTEKTVITWIVLFLIVVYSILGHLMIFFFERKREQLQEEIDYDKDKITEVEVSQCSVLIRGLNKDTSLKEAQKMLEDVFGQTQNTQDNSDLAVKPMISEKLAKKILSIHVVGDHNQFSKFIEQYNKKKDKLDYYENSETLFPVELRKKSRCWSTASKVPKKDIGHYKQSIDKLTKENEQKKKLIDQSRNFGIAFITFELPKQADKLIRNQIQLTRTFISDNFESGNLPKYLKLGLNKWVFEHAPCASDIVWEHFTKKNNILRITRNFLLNVLLFAIVCFVLNPVIIYQFFEEPITEALSGADGTFQEFILWGAEILIIFTYNYVLVPFLVDQVSFCEEFQHKSTRYQSNLAKLLLFLLIITVFLPITNSDTIEGFFEYMVGQAQDFTSFHLGLALSFLSQSEFFIKYLLQITFLTNIVQMLDIPHYLYMAFLKKRSYYKEGVKDDWYFDFAYHYAFVISVFFIAFAYSASAPFVPFFGILFFYIKYLVDKYNFIFVYPCEFESNGTLARKVTKYSIYLLFLFQLCICGFFTSIFGTDVVYLTTAVVLAEFLLMIAFLFWRRKKEKVYENRKPLLRKESIKAISFNDQETERKVKEMYHHSYLKFYKNVVEVDKEKYQRLQSENLITQRQSEVVDKTLQMKEQLI